jgi:hypothetical protein
VVTQDLSGVFPIPRSSIPLSQALLFRRSVSGNVVGLLRSALRRSPFGDEFQVYTDHPLAVTVPFPNLLAMSLTSISLVVLQILSKGIHLLDQPFSPHRPLEIVSIDWLLLTTFPSRECTCISLSFQQKIVSQDLVHDIALPLGYVGLPITIVLIIRASTYAPTPGFRPTSITAFSLNPRHRILASPCVIRNTGGCMRTRGGHRFALNGKYYIFFSIFLAFRLRRPL